MKVPAHPPRLQLLAWMEHPVPAARAASLFICKKPTDISRHVGPVCSTFVGDCVFGAWDGRHCRCVCLGEGAPGGYCRDRKTWRCTAAC